MAKRLLKQQCYCPMSLTRTIKTAVCLKTKAIFPSPLWVLIGVLAKFHGKYFTISSNKTIGIYFNHYFSVISLISLTPSFVPYIPLGGNVNLHIIP